LQVIEIYGHQLLKY